MLIYTNNTNHKFTVLDKFNRKRYISKIIKNILYSKAMKEECNYIGERPIQVYSGSEFGESKLKTIYRPHKKVYQIIVYFKLGYRDMFNNNEEIYLTSYRVRRDKLYFEEIGKYNCKIIYPYSIPCRMYKKMTIPLG